MIYNSQNHVSMRRTQQKLNSPQGAVHSYTAGLIKIFVDIMNLLIPTLSVVYSSRSPSYLLCPFFQQCHRFFFAAKHIVDVDNIVGQFIILFGYKPVKYMQVVEAVKDDNFFPGELINIF